MQVQELVGIVPWTFVAQICNLFIQMYLIKRFLFRPINEMLEKRKAMADAQITDAQKAREEALKELEQRAGAMGANAVIGVDIDYEVLGADNGMLMVTASGTAVVVD